MNRPPAPYRVRCDRGSDTKKLPCLRCGKPFWTTAERRICSGCNNAIEAESQPNLTALMPRYGDMGIFEKARSR